MNLEIKDNIHEIFIKLQLLAISSKDIYNQLPPNFKNKIITNYPNKNLLIKLDELETDIKYWLDNYEHVCKELNIKVNRSKEKWKKKN